jgi:hypothetical protein
MTIMGSADTDIESCLPFAANMPNGNWRYRSAIRYKVQFLTRRDQAE